MESFFDQHYLVIRFFACLILGTWWCASGVLLQWVTHNPLACPVTLGLTALPISLWMILFLFGLDPESPVILTTLFSALIFIHFFYFLWSRRSAISYKVAPKDTILVGIGMNLTLAAIYSFFHFYFLAQGEKIPSSLWFGLLKNIDGHRFMLILVATGLMVPLLQHLTRKLHLLGLGRSMAKNVCDVKTLEKRLFIFLSLLMSLLVITGGVFAFWGLILPHFIRKIPVFRGGLGIQVYGGSLFAGLLLAIADWCCYQFPIAGSELPVGLLSSILGPIFLILLLARNTPKMSN